ncbi:MAG: DUF4965 domain-containing protein [Planctomycetota bacterium]|nr:DUF4965 domain-containing protein [Planctomycetota bacterium]
MQLMTWTIARLGSRFNLLFEPYKRRVMHSALGRFLDQPLDLMVGLVEPDGTERVLPFTTRGVELANCEQFERVNSITYRGFSEKYKLRFEFNVHSVFYPQDEKLCLMPAFYLEMRVSPAPRFRWLPNAGPTPENVKLFIRLNRDDTQISASAPTDPQNPCAGGGQIDLAYRSSLKPKIHWVDPHDPAPTDDRFVDVKERIVSLNPGCIPDLDGKGLTLTLPVTEIASGVKWRLVWGAYCGDPILTFGTDEKAPTARFRYLRHWDSLAAVMDEAVSSRDDRLTQSRRFERAVDQTPLRMAQRHLVNQSFQAFLSNTFWCDRDDVMGCPNAGGEWFSVWEGNCFFHSTVDVEYNVALVYLTLWPRLLALQLRQWAVYTKPHQPSGGAFLSHDVGHGVSILGQRYPHDMPVEESCNYLLLLQCHAHWTGDLSIAKTQAEIVQKLAEYLIWTDRDLTGFPSEGTPNTLDDAGPAAQFALKQTYLGVKRVAALRAAGDLLARAGRTEFAAKCQKVVERDVPLIESQAWLGDHYAVCDRSGEGVINAWTGEPLPYDEVPGWSAYSISTANGLLLPLLCGQGELLDRQHLFTDIQNALRESLSPYGCGHTSDDKENVWISQNLWRDHVARYLGGRAPDWAQAYWDMQTMSNTQNQSLGFIDTYVTNNLCFYPRGVVSIGYLLAYPRLVIDRLATGKARFSVDPDRTHAQRWPLFPLADWRAGRIPVCVVDANGHVSIEGESDPIFIHDEQAPVNAID